MKTLEFFFDLSSPYSYLASTQVDLIGARTGARVAWKPFVLAAVFKAAGNVMPGSSPPKAKWMLTDLHRWAKEYGVDFRFSSRFPANAIKPMRLILAADAEGKAAAVAKAAFRTMWVDDRDITAEAELRAMATAGGLDPERALREIENPEIKERLKANTDEAIRRGAFGAPTLFVGDEMFWGNDRLHHVEALLRS